MRNSLSLLVVVLTVSVLVGPEEQARSAPRKAARARGRLPGLKLDKNRTIGKPVHLGRLTVLPIYARKQTPLGKFITLQKAVASRNATVSEISSGGSVGTLIIENKGTVKILVLGGTIVKGGKQDRQISEDLVIAPRKKVRVRANCVEQGRWNAMRAGKATQGKFVVLQTLANTSVRIAGQHKRSQSKVWRNVARYNKRARKSAGTGTLLATMGARDLKRKRKKLVARAKAQLDKVPRAKKVVGLAYAINGKIRYVRWFAAHGIFRRFRTVLLNTAALEAVVAPKKRYRKIRAVHLKVALAKLKRAKRKRTEAKAANVQYYSAGRRSYKTTLRYRVRARRRGAPPARPRAVTTSAEFE